MTSARRPTDLPTPAQRVVAWCLAGWILVADAGPRGMRYRLDPPAFPRRGFGPAAGRAIRPDAAREAIGSAFLEPIASGLFGAQDARAWRARRAAR